MRTKLLNHAEETEDLLKCKPKEKTTTKRARNQTPKIRGQDHFCDGWSIFESYLNLNLDLILDLLPLRSLIQRSKIKSRL